MSVFISYSNKDIDFVTRLSTALVERRINIWLDRWEMRPGDSLLDKIQNALTNASYLLIVLSKNSADSQWCKKELNAGLMRELREKQVLVIPILLDDCAIPLFLQEKIYADFRTDFEQGLSSLIGPLSRMYSEHMRRKESKETITDYAINYGLIDGLFFMAIDLVNWYQKERKSILLQINVEGCKNATTRFLSQVAAGCDWLMKESIIDAMYHSDEYQKLNIRMQNDSIYHKTTGFRDVKADLTFIIKFRAVLMGEDTNNDVLINFADFLEMFNETRRERMSDLLDKNR